MKWQGFSGINNRHRPEELKPGELSCARNVDIDDAKRLRRRDGYDLAVAGNYHSLWSDGSVCLVVKAGSLFNVNTDFSTSLLRVNVGDSPMSYVSVNGVVYYTNGSVIGYIENGADYQFSTPSTSFKLAPPAGQLIEYFNARLYIAQGPVLWFTDAMAFNRVDMRKGFKQLPSDIQMVRAVDGGIFVSDQGQTYFLSGASPEKFLLNSVCSASIPVMGPATIQGVKFSNEIKGSVAFFTTEDGLCAGLSDGSVIQLTANTYKLPTVKRGAVLIRENTDRIQLVTRLYN
jgi:hypothetical protein